MLTKEKGTERNTAESDEYPVARRARRMELSVSVADRRLGVAIDNVFLEGAVTRQLLTAP